MKLNGPLPADTLFQPKYLDNADAVLAMYHDQGLPVLKYRIRSGSEYYARPTFYSNLR